jgi:glycosyltransferase involved in cell wall biosynthesis
VIAGDGPERPRLEALTRELGIDQQLRLLGYRDDIARFSASDICVCCSDYEGGPLSVMDSGASHLSRPREPANEPL